VDGKSLLVFLIILAALPHLLAACGPNKALFREQADRHRTRSIGYWNTEWQSKPLAERIAKAPADLIEKIGIENRIYDIPERPLADDPALEFSAAIRQIESLIPESASVYILLHESGHTIGMMAGVYPSGNGDVLPSLFGPTTFGIMALLISG
jgi:hypothetical protein